MLTTASNHLSYAEYALPDFTPTRYGIVPGPPGQNQTRLPSVDSLGDRVVARNGWVLTAWDRRTGRSVGTPIVLATDDDVAGRYDGARVQLRPGPAWEAAVIGPRGVELWDMTVGRQTAVLRSHPVSVTFDRSGKHAAVVGSDYSVQVWDVDAGQPVGMPFLTSATTTVIGFTPDGLIAMSAGMPDLTIGHNVTLLQPAMGQRRAGFTLPPAVGLDSDLTDAGRVSLFGSGGRRPSTFPLQATLWNEHLCRLTNRPFTDAERSLLPPEIDNTRPCQE